MFFSRPPGAAFSQNRWSPRREILWLSISIAREKTCTRTELKERDEMEDTLFVLDSLATFFFFAKRKKKKLYRDRAAFWSISRETSFFTLSSHGSDILWRLASACWFVDFSILSWITLYSNQDGNFKTRVIRNVHSHIILVHASISVFLSPLEIPLSPLTSHN